MAIRGCWVFAALFVFSMAVLSAGSAQAGVVYTDETSYNNAVAGFGMIPAWAEDFEGISAGSVSNSLQIGGGLAEIVNGGTAEVGSFGGSGLSWNQADASPTFVAIQGAGGTALGLKAISFNFGNEDAQSINFIGIGVADTASGYTTAQTPSNFVGWVGLGPETVDSVQFVQSGGITLDNLDGFVAHAPEPGSFLLFGVGAAGLFFAHRRRKARAAK